MQAFDTPEGTVTASSAKYCRFTWDEIVELKFIPHDKALCGWGITKNLPAERSGSVTTDEAAAFASEALALLSVKGELHG